MSVDVCYLVSHGFAARMILHSGLVARARERGLRLAVVSPSADEEAVKAIAAREGFAVAAAPTLGPRRAHLFGGLRPYLYEDVRGNAALFAKHARAVETQRGLRRLQTRFYMGVNRVVRRVPPLREPFVRLEEALLWSRACDELLASLQPAIVVSTYPVDPVETAVLLAAKRAGIPTVGHLLSWDNITCKGRFLAPPDWFVAWGPIMRDELREHYGVRAEDVVETGVPHFDAHVHTASAEARGACLRALGLRDDRPYLFFGMSSPVFAPHEIDVVEWLARAVEKGRFGPGMQLVVRPHPQNVQGAMADEAWLPRLEAIRSARVGVDYPILEKSKLLWSMREDDLPKLANLLSGCAVSLNSGSTLTIDTAVHDRPIVLTLFDAGRALPWWRSAARLAEYPHLAKLVALGGARVVRSFDELEAAIARYLADPGADAEGRARIRREQLGACDGQAARRVADALAGLVGRARGQRDQGARTKVPQPAPGSGTSPNATRLPEAAASDSISASVKA